VAAWGTDGEAGASHARLFQQFLCIPHLAVISQSLGAYHTMTATLLRQLQYVLNPLPPDLSRHLRRRIFLSRDQIYSHSKAVCINHSYAARSNQSSDLRDTADLVE
jgi:hypothetical protein